jgi:hypothetical protein
VKQAGHRTIVVNRSWELAPWADHLYIADRRALSVFRPQAIEGGFTGVTWTPRTQCERGVMPVQMEHLRGLNKKPGRVNCGGTGGYQALNLAYHLGPARIILLGYDYQFDGDKTHWHDNHPEGWANLASPEERGKPFIELGIDLEDEGVEVINCSPTTSLTAFRNMELEDVL